MLIEFKYFIDSEIDWDGLGIIMYDYIPINGVSDNEILNLLVKIVDLYGIYYHYKLNDLINKYDINRILTAQNIKSFPSSELGFAKTFGINYGWNDVKIELDKIDENKKRIFVFFYVKDTIVSYGNDIVLIHGIKLTFKQQASSFRLSKVNNHNLIIDIPVIGQKQILLKFAKLKITG